MSTTRDAMKIVAATDLSPRSDRAFDRAVLIARSMDARLTLLHVVDGEHFINTQRVLVDEAEVFLKTQIAEVRPTKNPTICQGKTANWLALYWH